MVQKLCSRLTLLCLLGMVLPLLTPGIGRSQEEQTTGQAVRFVRLAEVLGTSIENAQREVLGAVDELVVGAKEGRIRYAALSDGGVFGLADKLFAVPWDSLEYKTDKENDKILFVAPISRKDIEEIPGFDKDEWPAVGDPRWSKQKKSPPDAVPPGPALRATQMISFPVVDGNNEKVGKIQEMIFDPRTGSILYLVLSCNETLGIEDAFHAVPWRQFELAADEDNPRFIIKLAIKQFLEAPKFVANDWRGFEDAAWREKIEAFYGGGSN